MRRQSTSVNSGDFGGVTHRELHPSSHPCIVRYASVSAGDFHIVWLRDDGRVVAAGDNRYGQYLVNDLGCCGHGVDVLVGCNLQPETSKK